MYFDHDYSELRLRRLLDHNGILLGRENDEIKSIRGSLLKKYYDVIEKDEEITLR